MDIDEYIDQQKLLKAFQNKAEKCQTRADMELFCKSFLEKFSEKKSIFKSMDHAEMEDDDLGSYLSTVYVPTRVSHTQAIRLQELTTQRSFDENKLVDKRMNFELEHHVRGEIIHEMAREIAKANCIDFQCMTEPLSYTRIFRGRLIVGKREK